MKYFNRDTRRTVAAFHKIISKVAGVELHHTSFAHPEEEAKSLTPGHEALLRISDNQSLFESVAIGRYIAKKGSKRDQLLGAGSYDQSTVDQWVSWTEHYVRFPADALVDHVTGRATQDTLDFKVANTNLRNSLKFLNAKLKDSKNLTGDHLTLADIYLACYLVRPFQLVLEAGFRKGVANVVTWFSNVVQDESFTSVYGNIKFCNRSLKPFSAKDAKAQPAEEKKEAKQTQPKEDKQKEEKGKQPKGDKKPEGDKGGKDDKKKDGKKEGKKDNKKAKEEQKVEQTTDVHEYSDPLYEKYKGVLKNAVYGQVVTRFPPEPSGYLHIGHIKAAMLNYHYSKIYGGKMILRFDDTNPSKEKIEFVQNIIKDLKTCEIIPDRVSYTSDYFDKTQEFMRTLIKNGGAYADNTPADLMKEERDKGVESKNKTLSPEKSLEIFEKMIEGEVKEWCIRANMNMLDKVKCLRDPVMYRCNFTPHHRTGSKYKAYPTYDFACPIVDSLEGVTNCLRTIEYKDRDALYHFVLDKLNLQNIEIFEYAKLQLKSTLMSKRKLQWFVDEKKVEGWYDPRFPTVQGLMRRGLTVETLKQFMLEQGPSLNTVLMEWDKLWSINKSNIDAKSKRYFCILKDSFAEVLIENGPTIPEGITVDYHPKDPSHGSKSRILTNHLYVEQEDVRELKVGDKFTLSRWGNVVVTKIEENEGRLKLSVELKLDDTDFSGTTKATFVPVDENFNVPVTIYEFGHLITKPSLKEEDNVEDFVNQNSRVKSEGFAEKDMSMVKVGDYIQIERRGFFFVDKDLTTHREIVLHFIPDGKTKNMSKIASKIASSALSKGEGEEFKAANRAEVAKLKGDAPEEGKQLSKNQLKKLAAKEKKKAKKDDHKGATTTETTNE